MSLEQFYYISQIIAVILILGSLIAIFFQQFRTNVIARAEMSRAINSDFMSVMEQLMTNADLAKAFRKVMFDREVLTPIEKTQILTYFNLAIINQNLSFIQAKRGLINTENLKSGLRNICWYLTAPVFAAEWRRLQHLNYEKEFSDYINGSFADLYPDHDISTVQA